MRSPRFWLYLLIPLALLSSCSRYLKQAGTPVSTRFETVYAGEPELSPDGSGLEVKVKPNVQKVTRYRNHLGLEWEESEPHVPEPPAPSE